MPKTAAAAATSAPIPSSTNAKTTGSFYRPSATSVTLKHKPAAAAATAAVAPVAAAPAPAPAAAAPAAAAAAAAAAAKPQVQAQHMRAPSADDTPPPPPPPPEDEPSSAGVPPPPTNSALQEQLLSDAFEQQAALKPPAPAPAASHAPTLAAAAAAAARPSISNPFSIPPPPATMCCGCGLEVRGSVLDLGDGRSFHPGCFTCRKCRQPIADSIIAVPGVQGGPHHEACVTCVSCGRNVAAEGFAVHPTTGALFCAEHARMAKTGSGTGNGCAPAAHAPAAEQSSAAAAAAGSGPATVCTGCREPVDPANPSEALVSAGDGVYFHQRCMRCATCSVLLACGVGGGGSGGDGGGDGSLKAFQNEGQLYCEQDYVRLFTKVCTGCRQHIVQGSVMSVDTGDAQVGALAFHPHCFNCARCQCSMQGGNFFLEQGALVCDQC